MLKLLLKFLRRFVKSVLKIYEIFLRDYFSNSLRLFENFVKVSLYNFCENSGELNDFKMSRKFP